jgi:ribosome-associated heat shock protein Hsp15
MYKSRTLAASAIKGGKVKMNGEPVKASHMVKPGEVYILTIGHSKKIIEVVSLLEKRPAFDKAKIHYKDLTPPEEKQERLPSVFYSPVRRDKGAGRPTKKDRRDIEGLSEA